MYPTAVVELPLLAVELYPTAVELALEAFAEYPMAVAKLALPQTRVISALISILQHNYYCVAGVNETGLARELQA